MLGYRTITDQSLKQVSESRILNPYKNGVWITDAVLVEVSISLDLEMKQN